MKLSLNLRRILDNMNSNTWNFTLYFWVDLSFCIYVFLQICVIEVPCRCKILDLRSSENLFVCVNNKPVIWMAVFENVKYISGCLVYRWCWSGSAGSPEIWSRKSLPTSTFKHFSTPPSSLLSTTSLP